MAMKRLRYRRPPSQVDPNAIFRDTTYVFIGSEDTHAVQLYVEVLEGNGLANQRRVKAIVIPTPDGLGESAPEQVRRRVANELEALGYDKQVDEVWLCLDVDRWEAQGKLQPVAKRSLEEGWRLSISRPCFELWLLLHLRDLDQDDVIGACGDVLALIRDPARGQGSYQKYSGLKAEHVTAESVKAAVRRARRQAQIESNGEDRWFPARPGTDVYRVVERIIDPNL